MGPIERLAILRDQAAALQAAIDELGVVYRPDPKSGRIYTNPAVNALINAMREIRALEPVAAEAQQKRDGDAALERRRVAEEERWRARQAEERVAASAPPHPGPSLVSGGWAG